MSKHDKEESVDYRKWARKRVHHVDGMEGTVLHSIRSGPDVGGIRVRWDDGVRNNWAPWEIPECLSLIPEIGEDD